MRRFLAAAFALVTLTLTPSGRLMAARDSGIPAAKPPVYELVVFEADGCIYCQNLRQDVAPLYRESALQREAPLRFVNVSHADETRMGLASGITIAPTVVLLHEGREVDRIVGYTGPFNFLKLVRHMMGRSEE